MNLKIITYLRFWSLFLLGVVSLFSCSSDGKVSTDLEDASELIQVNLSMDTDQLAVDTIDVNGELRLAYSANSTTGQASKALMESGGYMFQVAVARTGGTTQFQTLEFLKHPTLPRLTFAGTLKVPTSGSGNYKITAVLLKETKVGGSVYATVNTSNPNIVNVIPTGPELVTITSGKVATNVPYVATAEVVPTGLNKTSIADVWLRFRTSGSLLRFQFTNKTNVTQTINSIKIKTNAFFHTWAYNLNNISGGNLKEGYAPNVNTWEGTYRIPGAVTLAPGKTSGYYYLWVMPNKATTKLNTDIYAYNSGGGAFSLATTKALTLGGKKISFNLSTLVQPPLPFPGGKQPLEEIPADSQGFVKIVVGNGTTVPYKMVSPDNNFDPEANRDHAYHTLDYARAKFTNITIDGVQYHLPSRRELAILGINEVHRTSPTDFLEEVRIPGDTYSYTNRYGARGVATSDGYVATRFLLLENKDKYLSVYRYQLITNEGRPYIKITSRFLGDGYFFTNPNVFADPKVWETNNQFDVVRKVALLGRMTGYEGTKGGNWILYAGGVGEYLTGGTPATDEVMSGDINYKYFRVNAENVQTSAILQLPAILYSNDGFPVQ